MHVNLVFVTKYRREIFTKQILDELRFFFTNTCLDFEAHLVDYPPKVSVSKLVNSLKGVSSRLVRKKGYPTIQNALWGGSLWSPSYFAGACGGAPLALIRQYIEQQEPPRA